MTKRDSEQPGMPLQGLLLDRVARGKDTSPLHRALYGISLVVCVLLVLYLSFMRNWQWALFGGVTLISATVFWRLFDAPKSRHVNTANWVVIIAFSASMAMLLV